MTGTGRSLLVVVGSGGVGKTTLAAALGMVSARAGRDTLVMTFDPSLRLKDALGVGQEAKLREVRVAFDAPARLDASLLDARETFDRLIARYAGSEDARQRILKNRFYDNLSGALAGILEYMAVERLFEVARERRYDCVVLDTPPTRQALDFLQAPERIIGFLDSGALRIALKPWFDDRGRLRPTSYLGPLGRGIEGFLDRIVGIEVLRDMAEFFQAFGPLYEGFHRRAEEVQGLLRARETQFILVTSPAEERVADTVFFARRLTEAGHRLGCLIVNRVHDIGRLESSSAGAADGIRLLTWLGEQDRRGVAALESLFSARQSVVEVPMQASEPTDLTSLGALARLLEQRLPADWRW